MKKKDNIYKLIAVSAAAICSVVTIISLYLLFTGKTPAPTSSIEPANWSGNLYGRFFGATKNPNLCSIFASIGIISLIYLTYLSIKNGKNKVSKFFMCFLCIILIAINAFVVSISATTIIIAILLIVSLTFIAVICYLMLKDKIKDRKKLYIEVFFSACFLTLLLWGILFDMTIAYKSLEQSIPAMQENAYVLDKDDVFNE